MPALSYCVLTVGERHLKGLTKDDLSPNELLEAERQAKTTIDTWLLGLCGEQRGLAIIGEFVDGGEEDIDPDIRDLADLYASSIARRWHEARNFAESASGDQPRAPTAGEALLTAARAKVQAIRDAGKVLKADGATVRRLRYAPREQGPSVGGPMASGSLFDPKGYTTDVWGRQRDLPSGYDPLGDAGR